MRTPTTFSLFPEDIEKIQEVHKILTNKGIRSDKTKAIRFALDMTLKNLTASDYE